MKLPTWFAYFIPRRDQSFGKRYVRILFTWGVAIIVWETISSGVLKDPSLLPYFLALEVAFIITGAVFFAAVEHAFFAATRKRDG
jgi:hypothetical protein